MQLRFWLVLMLVGLPLWAAEVDAEIIKNLDFYRKFKILENLEALSSPEASAGSPQPKTPTSQKGAHHENSDVHAQK